MDHRGHPLRHYDHHSHRPKDREDYYRSSQQNKDHNYPPPNPRESGHWVYPDACHMPHHSSPPVRLQQYPYSTEHYPYVRPEHQRPHSRLGYNYPPYTHWDFRGYYDQDYFRGQQQQQDAGQRGPQDPWRSDCYLDRVHKQEHSGSSYTEECRYDQGKDNSQQPLNGNKENKDNEDVSSYYQGTLEGSRNSGLSSSSVELSQYIDGAEHGEPVHTPDAEFGSVRQTAAPLKYSIPHSVVSFGPAGQLIRVNPGLSSQENISQLEIHSLEVILSDTKEQQEMRTFPGPLTREDLHKVDAIEFAHQMTGACMRDDQLHDRSSAALLWKLLILLCRQNGQIVGSDIAELLMAGSHSDENWETDAPTLIDFSEGAAAEAPPHEGDDLLTGDWSRFCSDTSEKALNSYTQLLLAGRKKEALESAMNSGLWGHALFLASKMDNRSYSHVLIRFTGQIAASDPLQTIFQLLSDRIPAVATCYGNDKWGDWRPHLAVMLSNETGDPSVKQKAIVAMGDTLASKGLLNAAHLCYLTASVTFAFFTQKAERLVLLGSSHRQPFESFATNVGIQCTELYEYSQTQGGKCFSIPSFQVYKFLYASRLLDCGLSSQAFHYCEVVGQAILREREPFFVLTGEVIKLSDRLRHTEGQFDAAGLSGSGQEANWLKHLRIRYHCLQMGTYDCRESPEPLPEEGFSAHEDRQTDLESDMDALSCGIQSPVPELLYYSVTEDRGHRVEGNCGEMMASSWDTPLERPHAHYPLPVTVVYTPQAPALEATQDFIYHNTNSGEVRTASPHRSSNDLPSEAEGIVMSSGAGAAGGQLQVGISQFGQHCPSLLPGLEAYEHSKSLNEGTKVGWFSRWFKSKPKDFQHEIPEQLSPPQSYHQLQAAPPLHPPTITSPNSSPSQPSSAGQQLGQKPPA